MNIDLEQRSTDTKYPDKQSNLGKILVSDIEGGRKNEKFRIYHDLLTDYESKGLLALGVIAFMYDEGVGAYVIFGAGLAECLDCWTLSLMKRKAPPRKLDQINNEKIGDFEEHPEMYIK